MPLLAYFATVGVALTALLLLANVLLEPGKPEPPRAAVTHAVPSVPKPRLTTGSAADTSRVARPLSATQTDRRLPETQAPAIVPVPQLSPDPPQPAKTVARTKPKKKTAKTRAKGDNAAGAWRRYDPSAYSSYAQEKAARDYAAEGTLGPH